MNITTSYFPNNLKALNVWILWKLEEVNGRNTKVPYNAKTLRRASSTDSNTWSTFEEAVSAYAKSGDVFNGIGVVVSEETGLIFIDIDHCIEDGTFDERAEDILSACGETYSEISQSGTGIHIFGFGTIPRSFKNSTLNVEMYSRSRFCAMTGNAFVFAEIANIQPALNYLYDKYKTPEKTITVYEKTPESVSHDDSWIIDKASSHGDKFRLLYSGDWRGAGFDSQSEADFTLCMLIAYWADRDEATIDRIFRSSGLYREKWAKREDYRRETIQRACASITETFSDYTARMDREKNQTIEPAREPFFHNGKVTAGDVLKAVRQLQPANNELYSKLDDISSARLFADIFRSVARYCTTYKAWTTYDGIKWKKDIEGMSVEYYAKLLARALLIYSADTGDRYYTEYAVKLQDRRRRTTMIQDARDLAYVEANDFDRNPYLFNCQNCVIDLKTGESLSHDSSLLLSKVSNVYYDREARSPDFEKFIDEVMCEDTEKIKYLQHIFGYSLIGENTQEELYMIYGSTTRNGKSTLLDTLEYMFGDYSANCMPESLALSKDRNSRQASGDIARLDGVRFLHCGEPPKRMKFDVALVKSLTGGDVITARHLNEREFQFTPVFTLFINTNFLPVVSDDTLFSSERVKVISFDRHFRPEEQDVKLKARLKSKENLSGIFNWCLEGLKEYLEEGETLTAPDTVKKATDDYRESSDKFKAFMNDCLIPSPDMAITAKDAYEVYTAWCNSNGFGVENKTNFLDELRGKNLLSTRGSVNGQTQHNVIKNYMLDLTPLQ